MTPKRKDIYEGPGKMPAAIPKSEQLGKCTNCLDFKRLTDLASGVCVVKCTKRILHPAPEETVAAPNELEVCEQCGESTALADMADSEICKECAVDPGHDND